VSRYRVVRFFERGDREVITSGLTLEQARAHCKDPETSFKTATGEHALQRTKDRGPWFDGYEEQRP
jgi:hypothetical protein